MFFIFGNSMMIDSFVKAVKKMSKNIGISDNFLQPNENNRTNGPKRERDITIEE